MCGSNQRIIIFCPEIIGQIEDCTKIITIYQPLEPQIDISKDKYLLICKFDQRY